MPEFEASLPCIVKCHQYRKEERRKEGRVGGREGELLISGKKQITVQIHRAVFLVFFFYLNQTKASTESLYFSPPWCTERLCKIPAYQIYIVRELSRCPVSHQVYSAESVLPGLHILEAGSPTCMSVSSESPRIALSRHPARRWSKL